MGRLDMSADASGSAGSTAPSTEVPPAVAQVAAQRGFGSLISTRALANPVAMGLLGLVGAAVCLGLLILVSQIGEGSTGIVYGVLRFLALFACFAMFGALAFGISSLVRGAQSNYIYPGGVIHKRNSSVRSYSWSEVKELRGIIATKGDSAGKLLHYQLTPTTGKPFLIPLNIVDGRDEFLDHLIAALQQNGRPVV
jgi:hypothetical protein